MAYQSRVTPRAATFTSPTKSLATARSIWCLCRVSSRTSRTTGSIPICPLAASPCQLRPRDHVRQARDGPLRSASPNCRRSTCAWMIFARLWMLRPFRARPCWASPRAALWRPCSPQPILSDAERLVLYGGFARSPPCPRGLKAFLKYVDQAWGSGVSLAAFAPSRRTTEPCSNGGVASSDWARARPRRPPCFAWPPKSTSAIFCPRSACRPWSSTARKIRFSTSNADVSCTKHSRSAVDRVARTGSSLFPSRADRGSRSRNF